jgi:tRNA-splicing ligase RtcB
VYGDSVDEGALSQIRNCERSDAVKVALMADHHKGYAVPIGGVVAYEDAISPSEVGFDIGCGNKAILTDASADEVRRNIDTVMRDVVGRISFGVGRKNNTSVQSEVLERSIWKEDSFIRSLYKLASDQLGTVGSGNHYIDIFVDDMNRVWISCHFGSRGLGHKIASEVLRLGGAKDGLNVDPYSS